MGTDAESTTSRTPSPGKGAAAWLRLIRPHQWTKGVFVLIGPAYGAAAGAAVDWRGVALAFAAFALASSGCYILNDLRDAEADRAHPRKRRRPIAAGVIAPSSAWPVALVLLALGLAAALAVLLVSAHEGARARAGWTASLVAAYAVNVNLYSAFFKRVAMLDVVSLAFGFVLRVVAGCAAAGVEPSAWLLNVTLFASMFLAFGKRLGERRTAEGDAGAARAVQSQYTDDLLRMAVVVTAVACLVTYAGYVQGRSAELAVNLGGWRMNALWPTILPATFGLLRCIVLMERGTYDDPTELALRDGPVRLAGLAFVALTALAVW